MTRRFHGYSSRAYSLIVVTTALVLQAALVANAQMKKTDQEELEMLVHDYTRFEDAGDMASQSKFMADDRWWHGVGGRRTDNVQWMKVQAEGFANSKKRYPGLQVIREVRDLRIRLVAPTVAVTSFTWVPNRIIPSDLPADKVQALGPAPIPTTVSLVWARQADGWKIVSSHNSPLYLR